MADGVASGRMTVVRRTRLAVAGVAIASVLLLAVALYAAWVQHTESVRTAELSRQVTAIAAGLAAGGPLDLDSEEPMSGLRAELFQVEARLIGTHLVLTDSDGTVRYSSATDVTLERYELDRLTGSPDERGVRTGAAPLARAGRVIVVAAPVDAAPTDGYLVALQPMRELASVRRGGALVVGVVTLLVVAGAWVAGGVVAHRITAPIVRLRDGAEAIAAGSWGHQVPVEGDVEVAALARSFNAMSARVEAAYRAQKDFVGDVSHELRTPITSIQGFSGALLDGVAADPIERERCARIIRQEAGRLMELTSALLALADLDSGRVELAHGPVDTRALTEALRARHEHDAVGRGVGFEISDLGDAGRPLGDEERVLQVASALVGNALAYTPAEGKVRVTSTTRDGRWCLLVDDSGPGIAPADRERVFDRFVRLDPSRRSASGGSGLGLAICHRLVELMGGTIGVEDSDLGGARFAVCLETCSPGAPVDS